MKYKLAYTGLILLVYILGKCVPLYGIDVSAYTYEAINAEEVLMQTISGDAYRHSIFALGIFPFMISGLLVQVIMGIRKLFSKSQVSPKTMNRMSSMMTFAIAILQALVQVTQLKFSVEGKLLQGAKTLAIVEMVTGVMVILWLSKRNEKYGVGGRMVLGLANTLERITTTVLHHSIENLAVPLLISMVVMIIALVMENAEKRIPVQRISIHNIYADKNYMAIKLNPVGVMPVMFSTAVFMLPQLLLSLLGNLFPYHEGILWWRMNMTLSKPLGIVIYILCEYLLTIGFSFLMLSPKDIMEQFLKSGDSIVNLHAGRDTRRYLQGTVWRISLLSATVMGVCIAVPLVLQLRGDIDSTLTMLPSSVMMLTSFWCTIYRELVSLYKYDSCRPLF
ncbi:MAG: preprotein translocase subunit SecY [Lachnospiraceae bacterium]|nr:preprotein translocase subunit SecY [Lachnospiraceae bacterium]